MLFFFVHPHFLFFRLIKFWNNSFKQKELKNGRTTETITVSTSHWLFGYCGITVYKHKTPREWTKSTSSGTSFMTIKNTSVDFIFVEDIKERIFSSKMFSSKAELRRFFFKLLLQFSKIFSFNSCDRHYLKSNYSLSLRLPINFSFITNSLNLQNSTVFLLYLICK